MNEFDRDRVPRLTRDGRGLALTRRTEGGGEFGANEAHGWVGGVGANEAHRGGGGVGANEVRGRGVRTGRARGGLALMRRAGGGLAR